MVIGGVGFHWSGIGHIIRLLALLVDDDDENQDDNLQKNPDEGPQRGQVASDSQHGYHGGGADGVCRIALILSRVRCEVQVDDGELGVAVLAADEEASGGVVNIHVVTAIEFTPSPLWIRITDRFAVEDGSLPLILILAALVPRDVWCSFDLNGGICWGDVFK